MKKYLHLMIVLFVIAGLSGFILGVVNDLTFEPIQLAKAQKRDNGITKIFPSFDNVEQVAITYSDSEPEAVKKDYKNLTEYYVVKDEIGTILGYVFLIDAPKSYKSIEYLLGVDPSGKIIGTAYLSVKETPGLGTNVDPDKASNIDKAIWFNSQFIDQTTVDDAKVIAGASISSKSIINGNRIALNYFNNYVISK